MSSGLCRRSAKNGFWRPLLAADGSVIIFPVCVQCNKKAKRSDVVLLYAPRLKALDNSEQESLKR